MLIPIVNCCPVYNSYSLVPTAYFRLSALGLKDKYKERDKETKEWKLWSWLSARATRHLTWHPSLRGHASRFAKGLLAISTLIQHASLLLAVVLLNANSRAQNTACSCARRTRAFIVDSCCAILNLPSNDKRQTPRDLFQRCLSYTGKLRNARWKKRNLVMPSETSEFNPFFCPRRLYM